MKQISGSAAIVTGASRGIGVHIARALAREGVNLSLAARSSDELEQVRAEMAEYGIVAIATVCDVADESDRRRLIDATIDEFGSIDILVNNAGIERVARFEKSAYDDLSETIAVNLLAPMSLTHAVVPGMLERGRGHVVNIASGAGKVGVAFASDYCASKHGLVGFTNALRAEYHGQPIGFSVVCPGFVTGSGIYDRWEHDGIEAPKIAGSCSSESVAAAVLTCVRKDRGEVLVNTPPVRPLVVFANAVPMAMPWLLKRLGYTRMFERVADRSPHT